MMLGMLTWMVQGCASTQREDAAPEGKFVFVYLKSGPTSGQGTAEERKAIFAGHMSNMKRLADEGKLVVAGPFEKPADKTWRGIFIFDVETEGEARGLVATDPGIIAGEFVADCREFRSTPDLRRVPAIEKEMTKDLPPAKPGEPPANIRKYVMVTVGHDSGFLKSLAWTPLRDKVVWWGRFAQPNPRSAEEPASWSGVYILNETSPEEVREVLDATHIGGTVDGWWSSKSLERLVAAGEVKP